MSNKSKRWFEKRDIVIDNERGAMGYVVDWEWNPNVRSYIYEYICEYRTPEIEHHL